MQPKNPQNSSAGLIRFSKAAQKVLQMAHVKAVEQNSSYILPAHLLFALAVEEQGVAGPVFRESQITAEVIQRLTGPSEQTPPATTSLSPALQNIMEGAIREARHRSGSLPGIVQCGCLAGSG